SRRLLDRAAADLAATDLPIAGDWRMLPRVALRLTWVRTEWGLYSGNVDIAREGAARAAEQAWALPSPRHAMKTQLIVAATAAATGRLDAAAAVGSAAHATAGELGLLPLQWAAATLLAGVTGKDVYQREVVDLRTRLARRGMSLLPLEPGERLASIR
ncbi:MAG: hypothetical protein WAW85_02275, partial [Gordonia sp. (in: high G+C Gram-positive bacteria)]